jgi:hypothetical protein
MKQYIFRFKVSVQDVVVMHILDSVTNLLNYRLNLLLVKPPLYLEVLEETARVAQLH